jgi:hypothetical protein
MWFRIELHKDGSVATCDEVEGSFKDTRTVHYVEADSKAQAINALAARWERLREENRKRQAQRYADRRASGRCYQCGDDSDGYLCSRCAARKNEARRACVEASRKRGSAPKADRASPAALKAAAYNVERKRWAEKQLKAGGSRGATLRAVLRRFDEMPPRAFRAWLALEIERLEERGRARMIPAGAMLKETAAE